MLETKAENKVTSIKRKKMLETKEAWEHRPRTGHVAPAREHPEPVARGEHVAAHPERTALQRSQCGEWFGATALELTWGVG